MNYFKNDNEKVKILECHVKLLKKEVYFDVRYNEIIYKYLTVELYEPDVFFLKLPFFYCPEVADDFHSYWFQNDDDIKIIREKLVDFVKNNEFILPLIRKK